MHDKLAPNLIQEADEPAPIPVANVKKTKARRRAA